MQPSRAPRHRDRCTPSRERAKVLMVLRHVIALALGLSAGGCAKLGMADPVGDSEDSGMPTSAAAADTA